ncbi:hypothetical protein M2T79_12420 [Elizabethkingia miricola]|uniref:hypothetical protein n=1 Tax=Elizabethkingia miricola TaxID=172045 RepID=UPI0020187A53|nr:hypothetical protein [Elizabethkingia miricola]MCL1657401.1 hypothetical protein [Elizabethkingia miricola]
MLIKNNCSKQELTPLLGGKFCGTKRMKGFFLLRRGIEIDPATFDKDTLDQLITEGNFIGYIEPHNIEDNDQEAEYATLTNKKRLKRLDGVKGWRFVFEKGNCFQNELNRLDSSEDWTFCPVLDDGKAAMAEKSNGKLIGFNSDLFVNVYKLPVGTDFAGSTLEVDIDPSATKLWQGSADLYSADEFSFDEINSTARINIEVPALVAGSTTTKVKITGACSGGQIVGLTDMANWSIDVDGVRTALTGVTYDQTTGEYTFTHAALVAASNVSFVTTKNGFDVYVKDTKFYSGQSISKKVA